MRLIARGIVIFAALATPPALWAEPYKPNWKRIEGDNGSALQIDLNSINQTAGGISATIYVEEGPGFNINNLRAVVFQCPDRIINFTTDMHMLPATYLPPRSVGRQLADIACRKPPAHNSQ